MTSRTSCSSERVSNTIRRVDHSDLTIGEKLLLSRRRLGESQRVAAGKLGVSLYRYRGVEVGRPPKELDVTPRREKALSARLDIDEVAPHEECFILRVRARLSVRRTAELMNVSQWWFIKMERGREDASLLVSFWRRRRSA